jgi:hypothetical protein
MLPIAVFKSGFCFDRGFTFDNDGECWVVFGCDKEWTDFVIM